MFPFIFNRRSEEKKTMKPAKGGKGKSKGGNPTKFTNKKPKAGKGQRNPSKKNPGRKRR